LWSREMSKKSKTAASGEKEIIKLLRLVLIAGRSNSINPRQKFTSIRYNMNCKIRYRKDKRNERHIV
jgi:hypothetical protein